MHTDFGLSQEYIRRLVFEELSEATLADVLRRLLRLPWAECEMYVIKCLMKVSVACPMYLTCLHYAGAMRLAQTYQQSSRHIHWLLTSVAFAGG